MTGTIDLHHARESQLCGLGRGYFDGYNRPYHAREPNCGGWVEDTTTGTIDNHHARESQLWGLGRGYYDRYNRPPPCQGVPIVGAG
jgi:hypothetical protein